MLNFMISVGNINELVAHSDENEEIQGQGQIIRLNKSQILAWKSVRWHFQFFEILVTFLPYLSDVTSYR